MAVKQSDFDRGAELVIEEVETGWQKRLIYEKKRLLQVLVEEHARLEQTTTQERASDGSKPEKAGGLGVTDAQKAMGTLQKKSDRAQELLKRLTAKVETRDC